MKALDLGAADFLTQPVRPAVLRARLRNQLDLRRRTDAEIQTARQLAHRIADKRVAEIVNAASDAIVTVDAAGTIVLANKACSHLAGGKRVAFVGRQVADLLGVPRGQLPGGGQTHRLVLPRPDGAALTTEVSAFTVGEGLERLTTFVVRDVSARERLELAERSRLEAETSARTRTTLLSCIAHEMANPLNGLLGLLDLVAADGSPAALPQQSRRLALMRQCGEQLRDLLSDVLELGQIDHGRWSVAAEPIDVLATLDEALASIAADAHRLGVRVGQRSTLPAGCLAIADPTRLRQCLVNLLSNAVKYCGPDGQVAVEIGSAAGEIWLQVGDDGPGMNEAQVARLFEPFSRLGQDRSMTPGTGLGLLITRQLVLAMAGRLDVESTPGAGSRFTIVLKATQVGAAGMEPHESASRSLHEAWQHPARR